jgi:endonuclease YncB( thermonuclease family)
MNVVRGSFCRALFAVAVSLECTPAAAVDLAGQASVIDADTIEIHGQRIRLFGIDAPEGRQTCELNGQPYRCGQQAALALADYIGQRTVRCESRDIDRYQRVVSVCYVRGRDVGAWLVSEGWALAYRRYSLEYVDEEDGARTDRRGLWRGTFIPPWEWRQNR